MASIARKLRKNDDFRGYIHLKTLSDESAKLLRMAGLYAELLSINIELPSKKSLALYAAEKNPAKSSRCLGCCVITLTTIAYLFEAKMECKQPTWHGEEPNKTSMTWVLCG
jgi:predicted DNA-binding helix-hairpin-helix protein